MKVEEDDGINKGKYHQKKKIASNYIYFCSKELSNFTVPSATINSVRNVNSGNFHFRFFHFLIVCHENSDIVLLLKQVSITYSILNAPNCKARRGEMSDGVPEIFRGRILRKTFFIKIYRGIL